jgi:hypothetical protein
MFGAVIHLFRVPVPLSMATVADISRRNYAFLLAVPFIVLAAAMI